MSQFVRIEVEPTGIIHLTFDVQGESVNTLQAALIPEFAALLSRWQSDTSIMGLIIDSAKPGNFIAGADIHMLDGCTSAEQAQQLQTLNSLLEAQAQQLTKTQNSLQIANESLKTLESDLKKERATEKRNKALLLVATTAAVYFAAK